jgi:hypothetical protein
MSWPRDPKFFDGPKIVFPTMFSKQAATYIEDVAYFGMSTSLMIQKRDDFRLKYILGVLNSQFALHWFYSHGKKRGVGVDIGIEKLKSFQLKKLEVTSKRWLKKWLMRCLQSKVNLLIR